MGGSRTLTSSKQLWVTFPSSSSDGRTGLEYTGLCSPECIDKHLRTQVLHTRRSFELRREGAC